MRAPRTIHRHAFLQTRATMLVVDASVIVVSALVALFLRSRLAVADAIDVAHGLQAFSLAVVPQMMIVWLLVLWGSGAQSPRQTGAGSLEYQRVLSASVATAGLIGVGAFLTAHPLSRGFYVLFFVIGTPALLAGRLLLRRAIHAAHLRGLVRSRVLVAGHPGKVDELVRVLRREAWLGYEVVGALAPSVEAPPTTSDGVPFVGHVLAPAEGIDALTADAIVFTEGALPSSDDFRRTAWELESRSTQMIVVPAITDISAERLDMRPVAGLPLVYVERPQRDRWTRGLKRGFDIVAAAVLLVLLSPVILAVALAVKLSDGGPVCFRQARVGRGGSVFECRKFRSMHVDADARLEQLRAEDVGSGVLFKMHEDPRVTRVGRVLRRYSLDELPQLLNVLRGEMSLVGPRPPLPSEVEQYSGDVVRRLRVRPGMTGLWQVSGRSDLSWEETVRLDLYYADNWTIAQDLQILLRTVQAVVTGRGAY